MNKNILLFKNLTNRKFDKRYFIKIINKVLDIVGIREKIEISIVFVGDYKIRKLNKNYRGKDKITDVLSFELNQNIKTNFVNAPRGILNLGEIFICYPQAERQAKESGYSVKKELGILLVHGVLHLLGYDHEGVSKKERIKMERMEKKILNMI